MPYTAGETQTILLAIIVVLIITVIYQWLMCQDPYRERFSLFGMGTPVQATTSVVQPVQASSAIMNAVQATNAVQQQQAQIQQQTAVANQLQAVSGQIAPAQASSVQVASTALPNMKVVCNQCSLQNA